MDLVCVVMSIPFPNIFKLQDVQIQSLFLKIMMINCLYRWPRRLRRGSAAARLLGLRVRIPPGAWSVVSVVYCHVGVSASG